MLQVYKLTHPDTLPQITTDSENAKNNWLTALSAVGYTTDQIKKISVITMTSNPPAPSPTPGAAPRPSI